MPSNPSADDNAPAIAGFPAAKARKLFEMMVSVNKGDHFHQLGLAIDHVGAGRVRVRLPYGEHLVGNPDTGVIHGGVLTTMLDTCCGFATVTALAQPELCPTMDLRIDYMRPATPGKTLFAEGEVYRVTDQVIFTRGVAYHEDRAKPVAHCVANFSRLDKAIAAQMAAQIAQAIDSLEAQQ
ncbi:PaaI family thioesterase [Simiduia sp. 21SJ11W-1]|uniref:PaaI family thioesterase n=1 Tax=Simiduia sp. 21SJ11W-1 TaxID=2909669 RepID=UPI0020A05DB4|nr:PaaI family thioesterase [Simiduia sp. 21SJ11W-1]UTA46462.1 PaaI family thioesterase [Simiduia sp. 21SJ11W-1]